MSPFLLTFVANAENTGQRLDVFLASRLEDASRARVQQLIGKGDVLVNGSVERSSFRLRGSEEVIVTAPISAPPLRALPEDIPIEVVYEDDALAIINKPAGMMVHAGAGATDDARNRGTLVNALLHRFEGLSGVGGHTRPGIVHRLDRATSGLMVVAKNDIAHRRLAQQFSKREVQKSYIALVHGWPKQDSGTIRSAISRDAQRRTRMTTRRTDGRDAVTHYTVRRKLDTVYGRFALLDVKIETGRTHQIRVHMSSIARPVVGDTLYGAARELRASSGKKRESGQSATLSLNRNFLHSSSLELKHPGSGEALRFVSELPRELGDFLTRLEPGT